MKLTKLSAALFAATFAITPFSFSDSALLTPSAMVAEAAVATLPDWIPTDFNSAVEFRNTYGATHIDNGLVCVVSVFKREPVPDGQPQGMLRYETQITDKSVKRLRQTTFGSEYSSYYYEIDVFDPQKAGDFDIVVTDSWAEEPDPDLKYGHALARYSFSAKDDMNITETDLYSWLPDSTAEFGEYVRKNGEVSVKDNYVVFCTVTIDQFGDRWEPDSNNKYESFQYLLSSDCTMEVRDMYVDGSYDRIYVYQAVKDGTEKIAWTRTSQRRPDQQEPTPYTLTADCVILDNAQTVLLADQTRVTVRDGEKGELVPDEVLASNPFEFHADIIYRPEHFSSLNGDSANYTVTKNRSILKENYICASLSSLAAAYKKADHFEITTEPKPLITYYDNGAMDLVFGAKQPMRGDVNHDGVFDETDAALLKNWLLAVPGTELADWNAADFCSDNKLNAADLSLMKRALIQARNLPDAVSIREGGGVAGADIRYKVFCEDENYFLSYQDLTYDREARSTVIPITEQDYREIMPEAYTNYLESVNTPKRWSEIDFEITLSYADGDQKKSSSDSFPSVLTKLRKMLETYQTNHSSYVEPDEHFEYGVPFHVAEDGLKLYLGPDESYEAVASIPANTRLIEKGVQNGNNDWLFTEYNGQYGWINTLDSDGKMVIYFEEAAKKPVIYLYPEEETDVHVELELTESELNTTYPKYDNGWDVVANPDGTLLNKADGSHHRYLFWDAVNCRTRFDFSTGFCVAGSDTERFLKEKLTYMGLTEQEMNEFIVYWLPLMEHHAYNLISFQGDAYTNSAKLTVTPAPDSECRIFMAYVPLENAVEIEPQQLETFERKGFAVVEWGGVEIRQ